ncbi:hypothetical protein B0H14DRAFT_2594679 [Mycena olivaceomarginata]|nr:hypothetical protein B0H14DRAFT_2594679 [Mycena olivaceomarginata]
MGGYGFPVYGSTHGVAVLLRANHDVDGTVFDGYEVLTFGRLLHQKFSRICHRNPIPEGQGYTFIQRSQVPIFFAAQMMLPLLRRSYGNSGDLRQRQRLQASPTCKPPAQLANTKATNYHDEAANEQRKWLALWLGPPIATAAANVVPRPSKITTIYGALVYEGPSHRRPIILNRYEPTPHRTEPTAGTTTIFEGPTHPGRQRQRLTIRTSSL